tara:strand:+ start:1669 stop:1890 length:222 start_codon:yes stop_codon:yes gene_type:complete
MAMSANEIETMIKEALPNSTVVIEDLRGDGDHYSAHVKSELFNGKSKIQQHQMVYKALKRKNGRATTCFSIKN